MLLSHLLVFFTVYWAGPDTGVCPLLPKYITSQVKQPQRGQNSDILLKTDLNLSFGLNYGFLIDKPGIVQSVDLVVIPPSLQ